MWLEITWSGSQDWGVAQVTYQLVKDIFKSKLNVFTQVHPNNVFNMWKREGWFKPGP